MPWNSASGPVWWRMPAEVSMMTVSGTLSTGSWRRMVASSTRKRFPSYESWIFFYLWFQVKAMVQGKDRRPELGWKLAVECRKKINYPAKNKNSKYNGMTP